MADELTAAATAAKAAFADVPPLPGAPKPDSVLVVDGVRRTFGGITGDGYGATAKLTEVVVCTTLVAFWG